MQGMSFLVAWITSDARTELTEKSSSLEGKKKEVRCIKIQPEPSTSRGVSEKFPKFPGASEDSHNIPNLDFFGVTTGISPGFQRSSREELQSEEPDPLT